MLTSALIMHKKGLHDTDLLKKKKNLMSLFIWAKAIKLAEIKKKGSFQSTNRY